VSLSRKTSRTLYISQRYKKNCAVQIRYTFTTCKTLDSFINWTCRKLSHVFSSATFNSEIVWGFGYRFQNSFVRADMVFPFHSNLESIERCSFSSIYGQFSWRHCWETRAMHAEPLCILLNLPLRLAAVGCTLQWTLGAEINKQLQLLFATTLPLKLCHSDVTVV